MNMYEKGTQVHATTVFFVKDGALYVDEAKTVAATKEDAAKAILSGRVLINDGTDFLTVTSVAIDGTSVVVGSDSYTLS